MTYRIIAGSVAGDGRVKTPYGSLKPEFRVEHDATGRYTIFFEPPFSQLVAGSTTQIFEVSGQNLKDNTYFLKIDANKAVIGTGDENGSWSNREFTFVFIGVGWAIVANSEQ